jgi:SAM-dependent methyltransferase
MTNQGTGHLSKAWRRLSNIVRYGVGPAAREREKAAKARRRNAAFFDNARWHHREWDSRRVYGSYDEYVQHQAAKLDQILPRLRETEDQDFAEFKRRFESCGQLREARNVLCLGARIGTEVKALHALGYFAVGIDLNPGAHNAYVLPGDFHAIVFPDGSLDAIYTNALDHAFSLEKIMAEASRLLRPRGLLIVDLLEGLDRGFVPGEYEAFIWRDREEFLERISDLGGFAKEAVRDLGRTRRDRWTQVVFRKPARRRAAAVREAGRAEV